MAETETGWTKEFPSLKDGNHFWLRNTTPGQPPKLTQLNGGYNFYEPLGIVSPATEYLGPVTVSDAEQLIEMRKALLSVRNGLGCWCRTPFVNISEERPREPRCLAARAALNPSHLQQETQ